MVLLTRSLACNLVISCVILVQALASSSLNLVHVIIAGVWCIQPVHVLASWHILHTVQ